MPILIKLLVALLALNSALTFQNRWPTVGVRWTPELSIDLAVLLLVLALAAARWSLAGRALRNALLGVYLALILGRYVDVTVPALMGRSINLYWDSQHVPRVAALFADSVARWQLLLGKRPAGKVIRALSWLGPESAPAALKQLRAKLPESEWEAVRGARAALPSWMAKVVSEAMAHG